MLERELRKKVVRIIRSLDIWYYSPPPGPLGRAGIPDILMCINGKMVSIEMKQEKGRLTDIQRIENRNLEDHGAITMLIRPSDLPTLHTKLKGFRDGEI